MALAPHQWTQGAYRCYGNGVHAWKHTTTWDGGRELPFQGSQVLQPTLSPRLAQQPRWEKCAGSSSEWQPQLVDSLRPAGIIQQGDEGLIATFIRAPPKTSCHLCKTWEKNNFQTVRKAGLEGLGRLYRQTTILGTNEVLPLGSEIAPNGYQGNTRIAAWLLASGNI